MRSWMGRGSEQFLYDLYTDAPNHVSINILMAGCDPALCSQPTSCNIYTDKKKMN